MQVPYAARFATIAFLVAAVYAGWQLRPALHTANGIATDQSWMLDHTGQWMIGGWLWLLALFSWMVLLTALAWGYLPAHRIAGGLQSGLMIIAAVLVVAGIGVWMNVLPAALGRAEQAPGILPFVDALALSFLSSGCFMGGAATAWIAWDLMRERVLPRSWLLLAFLSGLGVLLDSLLRFHLYLLLASLSGWIIWCSWLSVQPRLPRPFSIWPRA